MSVKESELRANTWSLLLSSHHSCERPPQLFFFLRGKITWWESMQRWVNPTCWIYPGLNKIVFVYPALKTKIPMTTACPPERHHHLCPRFSKMPAVPCALNLELFSLCCNTKTKTTPSKWMNSQWKEASSGFLQRNST